MALTEYNEEWKSIIIMIEEFWSRDKIVVLRVDTDFMNFILLVKLLIYVGRAMAFYVWNSVLVYFSNIKELYLGYSGKKNEENLWPWNDNTIS